MWRGYQAFHRKMLFLFSIMRMKFFIIAKKRKSPEGILAQWYSIPKLKL